MHWKLRPKGEQHGHAKRDWRTSWLSQTLPKLLRSKTAARRRRNQPRADQPPVERLPAAIPHSSRLSLENETSEKLWTPPLAVLRRVPRREALLRDQAIT